uniref:CCHC-type domain-containing protein n=1 Tax=Strongyloides papillosus TaxID=174720 RepID=A0A0N5BJL7_STREA
MTAVRNLMPDIHPREELKYCLGMFVGMPLNNRLSEFYQIVRNSYIWKFMQTFDVRMIEEIKQSEYKSVIEYNARFLRKLNELCPEYEGMVYKIIDLGGSLYERKFLKCDLFNVLNNGLKLNIGKRNLAIFGKEKYLECNTKKVELLEGQISEKEKIDKDKNFTKENKMFRVMRRKITCQNCGKERHFIRFCLGKKNKTIWINAAYKTKDTSKPEGETKSLMAMSTIKPRKNYKKEYQENRNEIMTKKIIKEKGLWNEKIKKFPYKIIKLTLNLRQLIAVLGIMALLPTVRTTSDPKYVGDIFRVTNENTNCKVFKYIPMLGENNIFLTVNGTDRLRFEARKDTFKKCNCGRGDKGFYNETTKDCYIPTNTTIHFEGEDLEWSQPEMEMAAGNNVLGGHWIIWNKYVITKQKSNTLPKDISTTPFINLQRTLGNYNTVKKVGKGEKQLRKFYQERLKVFETIEVQEQVVKPRLENNNNSADIRQLTDQLEYQSSTLILSNDSGIRKTVNNFKFVLNLNSSILNNKNTQEQPNDIKNSFLQQETPFRTKKVMNQHDRTENHYFNQFQPNLSSTQNRPLSKKKLQKGQKQQSTRSIIKIIKNAKRQKTQGFIEEKTQFFEFIDNLYVIIVIFICIFTSFKTYMKRETVKVLVNNTIKKLRMTSNDEQIELRVIRQDELGSQQERLIMKPNNSNNEVETMQNAENELLSICDPKEVKYDSSDLKPIELYERDTNKSSSKTAQQSSINHSPYASIRMKDQVNKHSSWKKEKRRNFYKSNPEDDKNSKIEDQNLTTSAYPNVPTKIFKNRFRKGYLSDTHGNRKH